MNWLALVTGLATFLKTLFSKSDAEKLGGATSDLKTLREDNERLRHQLDVANQGGSNVKDDLNKGKF